MAVDEASGRRGVPSLAAPDEVLLRSARTPARHKSELRPLADSMSCAAPHRARASSADETTRRHAVVRRVERDRTGRSAGIARSGATTAFASGPAGEGASTHADWLA